MKVKSNIPDSILAAAAGLIAPYVPELSANDLLQAVIAHGKECKENSRTPDRLITSEEVAKMLSVSKMTVRRLRLKGVLHSVDVSAKFPRYRLSEISNLIARGDAMKTIA